MLRVSARALRRARLVSPAARDAPALLRLRSAASQRRAMGFFSDLKNQLKSEINKNEELKKSFEELERAKETVEKEIQSAKESVEKEIEKTKESVEGAAKSASQKIKDSYEENVKAAAAKKAEEEAQKAAESEEANAEKGEQPKATKAEEEGGAKTASEEVRFICLTTLLHMPIADGFCCLTGQGRDARKRPLVREQVLRRHLGAEEQDRGRERQVGRRVEGGGARAVRIEGEAFGRRSPRVGAHPDDEAHSCSG